MSNRGPRNCTQPCFLFCSQEHALRISSVSTANAPDHLYAEFLQMQVQRMNNTAKVEADARFDGLFVLGTNTKLAALRVP